MLPYTKLLCYYCPIYQFIQAQVWLITQQGVWLNSHLRCLQNADDKVNYLSNELHMTMLPNTTRTPLIHTGSHVYIIKQNLNTTAAVYLHMRLHKLPRNCMIYSAHTHNHYNSVLTDH